MGASSPGLPEAVPTPTTRFDAASPGETAHHQELAIFEPISGEAVAGGDSSGLAAVGGVELAEDALEVGVDRVAGDEEGFGDLGVGVALGEEAKDLPLPAG